MKNLAAAFTIALVLVAGEIVWKEHRRRRARREALDYLRALGAPEPKTWGEA